MCYLWRQDMRIVADEDTGYGVRKLHLVVGGDTDYGGNNQKFLIYFSK